MPAKIGPQPAPPSPARTRAARTCAPPAPRLPAHAAQGQCPGATARRRLCARTPSLRPRASAPRPALPDSHVDYYCPLGGHASPRSREDGAWAHRAGWTGRVRSGGLGRPIRRPATGHPLPFRRKRRPGARRTPPLNRPDSRVDYYCPHAGYGSPRSGRGLGLERAGARSWQGGGVRSRAARRVAVLFRCTELATPASRWRRERRSGARRTPRKNVVAASVPTRWSADVRRPHSTG
jgi:hypothetical protein